MNWKEWDLCGSAARLTERGMSVYSGSLANKLIVQKLLGGIWWHGTCHKVFESYRTFLGGIAVLLNDAIWSETMILIIQRDNDGSSG